MAPFVPFPDGVQVELIFLLDGEILSNRLWFWTDIGPPSSSELLGLADGVYTWYTDLILPALSSDLVLVTVIAQDWSIPVGPLQVTSFPSISGGDPGGSHSANVALVVGFRWPLSFGRLKRNKNYVAGAPLSAINLNTPTAGVRDTLFEGYAALIDAARTFAPGDYWFWVVASQWEARSLRSEQFFQLCIGPVARGGIKVGQRRKRLPD